MEGRPRGNAPRLGQGGPVIDQGLGAGMEHDAPFAAVRRKSRAVRRNWPDVANGNARVWRPNVRLDRRARRGPVARERILGSIARKVVGIHRIRGKILSYSSWSIFF